MRHNLIFALLLLLLACVNSNNSGENNYSIQNSHANRCTTNYKYKYFDLFTVQGINRCENDSCVLVNKKKNIIILETRLPQKYHLVLKHENKYWYSFAEFDMNKYKFNLSKSEAWPRRYDRFIFDNTIYEYEQMCYENLVFNTLYIKTPNLYKVIDLGTEYVLIDNRQIIFKKILKIIDNIGNKSESSEIYDVVRHKSSIQIISRKTGFIFTYTYPELQIWGLPYGLSNNNK